MPNVLRKRYHQHMLNIYGNHVENIITIQSTIRRFISKNKLNKLRLEHQNLAASFIQNFYINFKLRKCSKIITKFIRNIKTIKSYKLHKIKKNIASRKISSFIKSKIRRNITRLSLESLPPIPPSTFFANSNENTPVQIRHPIISTPSAPLLQSTHTSSETLNNIPPLRLNSLNNQQTLHTTNPTDINPTDSNPNVATATDITNRINYNQTFQNQIEFEHRFAQHQREIDEQLRETRLTIERISNYVNRRTNQMGDGVTNQNRRLNRLRNNIQRNDQDGERNPTSINQNDRLRLPQLNNRINTNLNQNRFDQHRDNTLNGITYQQRIDQIQEDLTNPRLRDIYANNRVYVNTPTGNARRILPNNGDTFLVNEQNGNRSLLPNIERQECLICLENRSKNLFIPDNLFECDHTICLICLRDMVQSAVNNVTTNIPLKCPFFDSCGKYIYPTDSLKALVPENVFKKFERFTLTKSCIPIDKLRYCPNADCECPYELITSDVPFPEEAPREINYSYLLTCFSCNKSICTYCNSYWHEGISCHENNLQKQRRRENETSNENLSSDYVNNYCKKCPNCNAVVQKLQNAEQEMHERETGLAGGTSECHHVTCSNCNTDFCWTCLKVYSGTEYYHRDCPNSDCNITFMGNYPQITHLPLGKINYIYLYIKNSTGLITSKKMYSTNGFNRTEIVSRNYPDYPEENSVILHCNDEGVVKKLQGFTGEYAFRQENKLEL